MNKFMEEMQRKEEEKRRLENLLGQEPTTPGLKAVHDALGTAPCEYSFGEFSRKQEYHERIPSPKKEGLPYL